MRLLLVMSKLLPYSVIIHRNHVHRTIWIVIIDKILIYISKND